MPKNAKPAFTEQSPGELELFHPAVRDWFEAVFAAPTLPQSAGWPAIARKINGSLAAFFPRQNPALRVFLPESEPELWPFARELGKELAEVAIRRQGRRTGLLIGSVNDIPARAFSGPFSGRRRICE